MEFLHELDGILSDMTPVMLDEMNAVRLMNRTDSKFLLNRTQLMAMAPQWKSNFLVQEIEGKRISAYKTLYFDTPDAITYTVHHNRQLHRQKIRQRIYLDTNDAFCEIKNKVNTGRTKKKRIHIPLSSWGDLYELPEMADFIREKVWITDQHLYPRLQNQFHRVTLVNQAKTERITIDTGISFVNMRDETKATVNGLVIVEVKQDGSKPSDFKQILRENRVQQKGLSKYCLGMLLTDSEIKYNRFKAKVRYVENLIGQDLPIRSMNSVFE